MLDLAYLLIDLSIKTLCVQVYAHDTPIDCYPVSVGKPSTPTPTGVFTIERWIENPIYIGNDPNILGKYALILDTKSKEGLPIAIHGSKDKEFQLEVSGGCIRIKDTYIEDILQYNIKYVEIKR